MDKFREFVNQTFYYMDLISVIVDGTRKVGNSVLAICDSIQETQRTLEGKNNQIFVQK